MEYDHRTIAGGLWEIVKDNCSYQSPAVPRTQFNHNWYIYSNVYKTAKSLTKLEELAEEWHKAESNQPITFSRNFALAVLLHYIDIIETTTNTKIIKNYALAGITLDHLKILASKQFQVTDEEERYFTDTEFERNRLDSWLNDLSS